MRPRSILIALLVGVLVVGFTAPTVTAADDISVTIETVCPAPVAEPVDIVANATIPDGPVTDVPVDVTLSIDDTAVTTETVHVDAGETVSVPFTYTYQTTGTHTVRVDAEGSALGETFESSASNDVEVVTDTSTDETYDACSSGTVTETNVDDSTTLAAEDDAVPEPAVPTEELTASGWERTTSMKRTVLEENFGGVEITADANTVVYTDTGIRADLTERTLGELSPTTNVYTATQIDVDPDITSLPFDTDTIMDTVRAEAKAGFVAELEDAGVTNVEQDGSATVTLDSGETVKVLRYAGTFPLDPIAVSLIADQEMTIEPDDVTVEGWVAIWRDGDAVMVVSGMYPGENVAFTQSSDLNDAITVTVAVDLGFESDAYREELFSLIESSSPGTTQSSTTESIDWRGFR